MTGTRWTILTLLLLLPIGACDRGWGKQRTEERAATDAALVPDGERIGYLLYERGLIRDPVVRARLRETLGSAGKRQAARDSAGRAYRLWLDGWVESHPEEVAAAAASRPLSAQEAWKLEARSQAQRAEERRFQAAAEGVGPAAIGGEPAPR